MTVNVSTIASGGHPYATDYTSAITWESATDNDLVTTTTIEILEFHSEVTEASLLDIQGATTNANFYRVWTNNPSGGAFNHSGVYGQGVGWKNTASTSPGLYFREDYPRISGIYMDGVRVGRFSDTVVGYVLNDVVSSGKSYCISSINGGSGIMRNCIGIDGDERAFSLNDTSYTEFINCIGFNSNLSNNSFREGIKVEDGATAYIINCASLNNLRGDWSVGTATIYGSGNASSDSSAPGDRPLTNVDASTCFANSGVRNLAPIAGSPLTDAGVSNAADYGGDIDIIGTARPQYGLYDIGAYEYIYPSQTLLEYLAINGDNSNASGVYFFTDGVFTVPVFSDVQSITPTANSMAYIAPSSALVIYNNVMSMWEKAIFA